MVGNVDIKSVIIESYMPFLDLLPSNINLVGAEIEMVELDKRETILKVALSEVYKRYDYIVIDCPPSLGLLTLNALTASSSVLIPVQCEYFALEGLGQLLNTINIVKQYYNPELTIEGVLLTMFDTRLRLSHQVAEEVRKYFGEKVFKTVINRNVRISEAPSFGKPIILYDAVSTGAQNYMAFAAEVLERNSKPVNT
jgi:chromosome partitioning protein